VICAELAAAAGNGAIDGVLGQQTEDAVPEFGIEGYRRWNCGRQYGSQVLHYSR
jgi:hypothetical protein